MLGKTARGASSPAKPDLTIPEPLSHTRAETSPSSAIILQRHVPCVKQQTITVEVLHSTPTSKACDAHAAIVILGLVDHNCMSAAVIAEVHVLLLTLCCLREPWLVRDKRCAISTGVGWHESTGLENPNLTSPFNVALLLFKSCD